MSVRGKKEEPTAFSRKDKDNQGGCATMKKIFALAVVVALAAFVAPTFAASLSIDVPMIHRGYDWEGDNALGFTFLWREYVNFDEYFYVLTSGPWDDYGAATYNAALYFAGAPDLYYRGEWDNVFSVLLTRKWNNQWTTFHRYFAGKARYVDAENMKNWTFGVKYYYTPGLSFELAYDKIENSGTTPGKDDRVIRLRTVVTF